MPDFLKHIGLLLMVLTLAGCNISPAKLPERLEDTVRVATYNVHYIWLEKETGAWSVSDWERRKGPLNSAFQSLDADIVTFQEMESFFSGSDGSVNLTRDWLLENNPDYAAAAIGDWREFPSTQPIFYRADRFKVLDQGWFFFSNTPDVIYSNTFNGSFPAFASWARFEDINSGDSFTVFNVHFEFKSFSNRRQSAELAAERITPHITAEEDVLFMGDVNAFRWMKPVRILEGIGLDFLPVSGSTYHLNRGVNLFGAIDQIAHTPGLQPVGKPVVLREKFDGEWPTDHYPVVADFRFSR